MVVIGCQKRFCLPSAIYQSLLYFCKQRFTEPLERLRGTRYDVAAW